jgi:quinol monooxygenase YgiN
MRAIETVAVLKAKEGRADDLLEVLRKLASATQAEDGCVFYSLQRGLEDASTFVTVERWASREALADHRLTPHLTQAREDMASLLREAPQVVPTTILDATGNPKAFY